MGQSIFFFREDHQAYGCFSQFYKRNFTDPESGRIYNCMEQYLHFHKAVMAGDERAQAAIMKASWPRAQKALGRSVQNFDADQWDRIKCKVAADGNYLKFTQNKDLRDTLLRTEEDMLVEASPYDKIWFVAKNIPSPASLESCADGFVNRGIGFNAANAPLHPKSAWCQNLLGKVLVEVRAKIRNEADAAPALNAEPGLSTSLLTRPFSCIKIEGTSGSLQVNRGF